MLGFYSIRKLTESAKLTDEVSKMGVPVRAYPATGRTVHLMNWHQIEKLYDLNKAKNNTVSLPYLCNQVIHSYVFSLLFEEKGGLVGVFVASDRERSKELLEVSTQKIIDAFERVAGDDANNLSMKFDSKKGDYTYRKWHETYGKP